MEAIIFCNPFSRYHGLVFVVCVCILKVIKAQLVQKLTLCRKVNSLSTSVVC